MMLRGSFDHKAKSGRSSLNMQRAIRRWKPWKQCTGPKSPAGKRVVSGNVWTGGDWLMLRKAASEMNEAIRQQRKGIGL